MDWHTDGQRDGRTHRLLLYSTGHRPLCFRCPSYLKTAIVMLIGGATVPLTIYCLWATGSDIHLKTSTFFAPLSHLVLHGFSSHHWWFQSRRTVWLLQWIDSLITTIRLFVYFSIPTRLQNSWPSIVFIYCFKMPQLQNWNVQMTVEEATPKHSEVKRPQRRKVSELLGLGFPLSSGGDVFFP